MRMDPDLWAELERLAATELRSVNGQIEYLLREAINQRTHSALALRTSRPRAGKLRNVK